MHRQQKYPLAKIIIRKERIKGREREREKERGRQRERVIALPVERKGRGACGAPRRGFLAIG